MNVIVDNLTKRIEVLKGLGNTDKTKPYYQVKFEYYLIHLLAYLWNKNIEKLSVEDKEYVVNTIMKPSIGSIVATCRQLDTEKEFFSNPKAKKLYNAINDYPRLRNERIGHGYSFDDSTNEFVDIFERLFEEINDFDDLYLTHHHSLVKVLKKENGIYTGLNFDNGNIYSLWTCPVEVQEFELDNLYSYSDKYGYNRISPFVHYSTESEEFYIFSSVVEKLTGKIKYNKITKTGTTQIDHEELASFTTMSDQLKKRSGNGTIITQFDRNFKKYFDVGLSRSILRFLLKNKSSVFATVWGHGGVGKTAAVQHVCDTLINQQNRKFDYIIFLSAKDRYYNYYKGQMQKVDTAITGLDDILRITNQVIFNLEGSTDVEKIENYEGKLLLVIDDFETFRKEEKNKITEFIKTLDINYHKVLITTRSVTLVTGEEIPANELNKEKTIEFLFKALESEVPTFPLSSQKRAITKLSDTIWRITSGRPLFILQFAVLLGQKGHVNNVISYDISNSDEAKKFLYNRIYDYLSSNAKNLFHAIGLVANKEDLTGPTAVLQFLMNLEDEEDDFEIILNELVKLKIIFVESDEVFSVYSKDVLKIISEHSDTKRDDYNSDILSRYSTISSSKSLDINEKMLDTAEGKRYTSSEGEVEGLYRRLIKREKASKELKLKALISYGDYLASIRKKIEKTLKVYKDFASKFKYEYNFVVSYSNYLWVHGSPENQYNAVMLIREYLSSKPKKLRSNQYNLLIGNLMTYETNIIIREREELKSFSRFNELSPDEITERRREQSRRFQDLAGYPGSKLKNLVGNGNIMSFTGPYRLSILDGLVNYIEILIRTMKIEDAKQLAETIMTEVSTDYHPPFIMKLRVVDRINNPFRYDKYGKLKPDSVLGLLLKQAITEEE